MNFIDQNKIHLTDEERVIKFKEGDIDSLLRSYLPYIGKVTRNFINEYNISHIDVDDMFQSAAIEFLKCVDKCEGDWDHLPVARFIRIGLIKTLGNEQPGYNYETIKVTKEVKQAKLALASYPSLPIKEISTLVGRRIRTLTAAVKFYKRVQLYDYIDERDESPDYCLADLARYLKPNSILYIHYIDGLTITQIANKLGVSYQHVYGKIRRGEGIKKIVRLKDEYDKELETVKARLKNAGPANLVDLIRRTRCSPVVKALATLGLASVRLEDEMGDSGI